MNTTQSTGTWILLAFYVTIILWLVFKGAGKTRNLSDYALGSVFFSPIAVGLSLAASMTSAATFVINPGFIANYGLSALLSFGIVFPIAAILSLVVLTKSFRKYGQTVKALTLAQWIGQRYNSKTFSSFMAFLSLLLITFIVLIVVAISKVLARALDVEEVYIMISVVIFVFGYMMFGGANSLVYTNTIQAIIMVVVAIILIGSGYHFFKDGIVGFFTSLSNIDPVLTKPVNPQSPLFRDYYEIIFAQIVVGVAVVVQPHIITKSLMLKSDQDVSRFLITAVVVQLLFFAVVVTGLFARMTFPDLSDGGSVLSNDSIIPAYVIKVFSGSNFGIIVSLLVILGLISAGMSTLEGLVQSVSTTITSDIIRPMFPESSLSESRLFLINKGSIVFLALITMYFSYEQLIAPKLSVGIFAQNGVYAFFSAAFVPVIFGIFSRSVRLIIPFTASIVAVTTHFSVYYLLPWLHETYGLSLGLFDMYLEGVVKNPAIASSTAIIFSLLIACIMLLSERMFYDKAKPTSFISTDQL